MLDRAGIVGEDGPTHHGTFDISYLRMVPHFVIMTPCDENELRRMLLTALEYGDGPIAVRFPRGSVASVEPIENPAPLEVGRGIVLREGSDASIFAVGTMVRAADEAADILKSDGVSVTVVNARFVKPLDGELLIQCAGSGAPVFTCEENIIAGGFGDAISELLENEGMKNRLVRIGIPDRFVPHGRRDELLAEVGLSSDKIAATVIGILRDKSSIDSGGTR